MYHNEGTDDLVGRFEDWWHRDNHGLPLMHLVAVRDDARRTVPEPENPEMKYLDTGYLLDEFRERVRNRRFLGDSYANLDANLGPGSMALYLGGEPRFAPDTVWYEPVLEDAEKMPDFKFDPENKWWTRHQEMLKTLKAEAGNDFLVNIPDLIENLDIYAALRGPQTALFDLMDDPEMVEKAVSQMDDAYFRYYDAVLDIVKDPAGISSYTCFQILGKGRVAKIQCDFSAMISPEHYRQFVLPSLKKQAKKLDHSLYHLDGPGAIRHVPAIMEIEELDALQWTCGAAQPDGACPRWYPIYDQVAAAGKGLWVQLYDGGVNDWIRGAESLMNRYGKKIFYFQFPDMSEKDMDYFMNYALTHWDD